MGVVEIRFRQAGLGNLPGVRAVDTSGLIAAARQRGEDARAIKHGMDSAIGGAINAANAIAAAKEADNKNEANKLYKDYVTRMDDLTGRAKDPNSPNSPEGLFRAAAHDDNAARNLADDLRKAQGDMRSALGLDKQSARVRELFEEQAFAYDRSHANRANDIMATRFHESRVANAEAVAELTRREAANTPTAESLDTYARALEDVYDASGTPTAQRVLLRQKAQEDLVAAYLDAQLAHMDVYAATERLDAIKRDDLMLPNHSDAATRAFMQRTWDRLAPATKAKATQAIEAKRDALLKQRLDALDAAQYEGRVSYGDLVAERDRIRDAQLAESAVIRLNAIIEAQRKRDVNAAILGAPASIADAPDTDTAQKSVASYAQTLPEHVTQSPEWVAFARHAAAGDGKAAASIRKDDLKAQANAIVYDMTASPSDKRVALTALYRSGGIDIDAFNSAVAAVQATEDKRTAALAQRLMASWDVFQRAGIEAGEGERYGVRYAIANAIGEDGDIDQGSLRTGIRAFFEDAEDRKTYDAYVRVREAYEGWARACQENPSWTEEQCAELFHQAMRYPLEALTDESLSLDEEQSEDFRRQLGGLSAMLRPLPIGNDFDFAKIKDFLGTPGATEEMLTPAQAAAQPGPTAMAAAQPKQPNADDGTANQETR